jgi:hypothetical protein
MKQTGCNQWATTLVGRRLKQARAWLAATHAAWRLEQCNRVRLEREQAPNKKVNKGLNYPADWMVDRLLLLGTCGWRGTGDDRHLHQL